MNTLRKLIKESLQGYNLKKKSCSCGCNTCEDKRNLAPILNESIAPREILSEGLKYHIDNNKPLTEHVYRAGSQNYFNLWSEARALYSRGIIDIKNQDDLEILTETQLGEFGMYEGKKVPLDFIMEYDQQLTEILIGEGTFDSKEHIAIFSGPDGVANVYKMADGTYYAQVEGDPDYDMTADNVAEMAYKLKRDGLTTKVTGQLTEADKKKKTPPIGKPKRGGSKKFYVYVKDKGKVKKVSFGAPGMSVGFKNPKRRKAFAARHKCAQKTDRTKPSYWSCRVGRYAKQLGLGNNFSGFW